MALPHSTILQLKRWNTPTIYNGWEQIMKHDRTKDAINLEPVTDYMPEMGPMVGYAVTVKFQPSVNEHAENKAEAWANRAARRRLLETTVENVRSFTSGKPTNVVN